MSDNQELIDLLEKKISRLQRALYLATDENVMLKYEDDLTKAKKQLAELTGESPPPDQGVEQPGVSPGVLPEKAAHPPAPPPPEEPRSPGKKTPPWWLITIIATLATFCLAWWMLANPKIAACIALVVGLWLLFRNPELLYQRLALTAMGLVVVLNAINFSGYFGGRVGENEFRLELSEPSVIVSLSLIAFAGYMMFLHSRR